MIVNVHALPKTTVPGAVKMEHWNVPSVNATRAFLGIFVTATNRIFVVLLMIPCFHACKILVIIQLYVVIKEAASVDSVYAT